jgi:site-specific DNA recombinase
MFAAIYARKSTDQNGVSEEQRSVARQVEHATAYARRKGWQVADEYVYIDDGISGAEFATRPGFVRLMASLKPEPPFGVLIMSEESRLGREQIEVSYALKQLVTSGVRVFCYLTDTERTLDSPIEKAMLALQAMADEMEREKARHRVKDAMARKARAGHCCGGRVFGYRNVPIVDSNGRRSHVERQVEEAEAAVVRRIFELCAAGTGYTRIAKQLNEGGAPAPAPKRGRVAGWAPSSVKVILDRRLYLGEVTYNRREKRDTWGQKRVRHRPQTEWICHTMPELRIVSDELWEAAHSRLAGIRDRLEQAAGGPLGRRRRDIDSSYLLAGFARCATCGGGIGVMGGSHQTARPHSYGCLAYHKRGTSVCANGLKLPIARVDGAVLETLVGDVLRPAVVEAVIEGVLAASTPPALAAQVEQIQAELREVERAITNLARAIAAAGPLEPLLVELKRRQGRQAELLELAAAAQRVQRFDRRGLTAAVGERLARWRDLLTTDVVSGRQFLREALRGPLRFTPEDRAYRFDGEIAFGGLLTGAVESPTNLVPVRGFEPRSRG